VSSLLEWFNVERAAVLVAAVALLGVFYTGRQARAAKAQASASKLAAVAAERQAQHAEAQVQVAREQTTLLIRQLELAEDVAAETRRAQRDALQPMVVVDISPGANDPSVFVLTIKNVGQSTAHNVKIAAPTEMVSSSGKKMHEWTVFAQGVKTMPPGHKLQFFFDVGFQRFSGRFPMEYSFVVDCEGPFGPAPQLRYDIDLSPFRSAWVGPTTLGSVVKEVERVSKSITELRDAVKLLDPEYRAWIRRGNEESDRDAGMRRI
jgi:hypothetical protein